MCARREPVQVAQTVGPAHCPPFSAGPARASGGREAARLMTVPRNGGPRSGPYSAKRTLAGSAIFWGDGRGWRAGPAPVSRKRERADRPSQNTLRARLHTVVRQLWRLPFRRPGPRNTPGPSVSRLPAAVRPRLGSCCSGPSYGTEFRGRVGTPLSAGSQPLSVFGLSYC